MKKERLGWFWGLLGKLLEAFEPQDGPKLKNKSKTTWKKGHACHARGQPVVPLKITKMADW